MRYEPRACSLPATAGRTDNPTYSEDQEAPPVRAGSITENKTEEKIIAPPDLAEALTTIYEETTA